MFFCFQNVQERSSLSAAVWLAWVKDSSIWEDSNELRNFAAQRRNISGYFYKNLFWKIVVYVLCAYA